MSPDEVTAVYNELRDKLFKFCKFKLSNDALAEEITQETFLRFLGYIKAKTVVTHPKALLFRIASNLVIDQYRRKKAYSLDALRDNEEINFDVGDESHKNIEVKFEIKWALKKLPYLTEWQQKIFIMRYLKGMTPIEIGFRENRTPNAISVELHRTMRALRSLNKI